MFFVVITVALETVLGLWMAITMSKSFWGRSLLRAAVLIPVIAFFDRMRAEGTLSAPDAEIFSPQDADTAANAGAGSIALSSKTAAVNRRSRLDGIVCGIFGVSKLLEMLLKKWKGLTYCAIMGLVLASPVAIVWTAFRPEEGKVMPTLNAVTIILSLVMMAIGFAVAWYMASLDRKN